MTETFAHLLSGTDIRGVAVDTPEKPATLTVQVGLSVGVAFARWLAEKVRKPCADLRVAVGRDSRITGEVLKGAMIAGLEAAGVKVLDCGLCTTPAMFMSTVLLSCDGAVMVTASHLPWQRNGYKFFAPDGGLESGDVRAILRDAAGIVPPQNIATAETVDFLSIYADFLKGKVTEALGGETPLAGLHIVVDAGNGAGGFFAQLLSSLGADTTGSQYLEADGHFPNHTPNPEDPAAMQAISNAVLAAGADLGVIFDADCDRAAMVDKNGLAINRNRLIALIGTVLLQAQPGITIVSDSVTSAGLDAFIAEKGGRLHRFMRGYRNVIDEAKRLNAEGVDCPLAIETSGHAALRENHFLDDGMYLMMRLIIEAEKMQNEGRQLTDLIERLREPAAAIELRLSITEVDFRAAGEQALSDVKRAIAQRKDVRLDPENREGIRILFGTADNWLMLRLSLHDPQAVINAESENKDGILPMLRTLYELLQGVQGVDLSALEARLNTSSHEEEPK